MADLNWADVKNYLSNLTIKELADKVKELEDEWGVEAATGGGGVVMQAAAAVEEVEQTEFDAVLVSFGPKKIKVIKVVRELTGLGLREAKALVEAAPTPIKEQVAKEEAEAIKEKIEAEGGAVEIK
jgi:large subunit ribosomal protein L7/L12